MDALPWMGDNPDPAIALCSTVSGKSKEQMGNIARHLTRDAVVFNKPPGLFLETSGRSGPAQVLSVYIVLYASHTNGALEATQ